MSFAILTIMMATSNSEKMAMAFGFGLQWIRKVSPLFIGQYCRRMVFQGFFILKSSKTTDIYQNKVLCPESVIYEHDEF